MHAVGGGGVFQCTSQRYIAGSGFATAPGTPGNGGASNGLPGQPGTSSSGGSGGPVSGYNGGGGVSCCKMWIDGVTLTQ